MLRWTVDINTVLMPFSVLTKEYVNSTNCVHIAVVPVPCHGLRFGLAEQARDAVKDAQPIPLNLRVEQVTVGQWFHNRVIMCRD
jgi:hypothetical protein